MLQMLLSISIAITPGVVCAELHQAEQNKTGVEETMEINVEESNSEDLTPDASWVIRDFSYIKFDERLHKHNIEHDIDYLSGVLSIFLFGDKISLHSADASDVEDVIVTGSVERGKIDIPLQSFDGYNIIFRGKLKEGDNKATGEIILVMDGEKKKKLGNWKASRLWGCGNHTSPRHAATNGKEIREKTEEYKCESWSQI